MNKDQQSGRSKKLNKVERNSKKDMKTKDIQSSCDKAVKICTTVQNYKKIKKTLNSVPLTEKETLLSQNKRVQYSTNKNILEPDTNNQCSRRRNKKLDKKLQTEFEDKVSRNPKPKSSLFIFEKREEFLDLIDHNQVIVVHGEPQSGKTTQIPQFILDQFIKSGNGSLCKIVSTQPFKKSVTAAFEKVNATRRELFGDATGINFQVRFNSSNSRYAGSVTYCTSGFLLKKISNSLFLNEITHLIIDEIHERDISTDFLLAIMKQVITKRTDLKLILICNTIYSRKIAKYFNNCKKINVSADLHPIEEYYLEDTLNLINFKNIRSQEYHQFDKKQNKGIDLINFVRNYEKSDKINAFLIVSIIKYIYFKYREGAILILLPSISTVRYLATILENETILNTQIITSNNLDMSIDVNKTNRQIFLATNEKFVDLNNNNILVVINSGKIQVKFHDATTNTETFQNNWISQKISKQRKNIAGRKNPGVCFHLFSEETKRNFDKYPSPEIMSYNLEKIILDIKGFGIPDSELFLQSCLTCPDINCIRKTIDNFKSNNILTSKEFSTEFFTPLGFHVSKLPLNFAVGKMVILGALFSCVEPILTIAAYLDFRSIFVGNDIEVCEKKQELNKSCDSDIIFILDLLSEFEKSSKSETDFYTDYLIRPLLIKDIDNIIQQLAYRLFDMNLLPTRNVESGELNINSKNARLIKALVSVALYPNIAVIRNYNSPKLKDISIETITNVNVFIHPSSINRGRTNMSTPLLMYRNLLQSNRDLIQDTTLITPVQVLFFANDVKYSIENHYSVMTVANSLRILSTDNTASIIKLVQEKFNIWFEYKLRNPGYVKWEENSWDTATLRAVVELLNNEGRINDFLVLRNCSD